MKKVIAIIGNQQKNNTYRAVCEFEAQLRTYGEVEVEYVFLKDYRLEFCRGCKVCFNKGEEYCPLRDDRDVLIEKLENADGVIMATPNYAFHVSAAMKNLLDRLAYVFHRPQFFGKTYTSIVNQGIHGGKAIRKYLSSMGENFGFQVTRGCVLQTMEPVPTATAQKNSVKIRKSAARFYKGLMRPAPPTPTLFRLLMFRLSRTVFIICWMSGRRITSITRLTAGLKRRIIIRSLWVLLRAWPDICLTDSVKEWLNAPNDE